MAMGPAHRMMMSPDPSTVAGAQVNRVIVGRILRFARPYRGMWP